MKLSFAFFLITAAALAVSSAQSPAPVIIQAISPTQQTAPRPAAAAVVGDNSPSLAKPLQEMKAANDQILQKQAAALQRLEEIEKAAEQIKIYTKRG
jgi:hypothetical protein